MWQNPGDIILLHMHTINEDHMMYGSWDIKTQQTEFFVILGYFLPFYPTNSLKNQNLEKMKKKKKKKMPGDIIILHQCTKNHNHMLYYPWDMACDRLILFILGYFLPFYPKESRNQNSPRNQNLKKKEKTLEVSSFETSVPKIMIICYTFPEIWHMMVVIVVFHFRLFFALFP